MKLLDFSKSETLIIIPAYNEEDNIAELVRRSKKYGQVCVVNDASTDRTEKILASLEDIQVINHAHNTHIPGAVLDGMQFALGQGFRYAVTMDAGFSHVPEEIPGFFTLPDYDLLIGVRREKYRTPLHRKALSLTGNWLYNLCLDFPRSLVKRKYFRDITSGFRRYSAAAMEALLEHPMVSRSFDFLFESAMVIYRRRLLIGEVPISYRFGNSSLNSKVVGDCLRMCIRSFFP